MGQPGRERDRQLGTQAQARRTASQSDTGSPPAEARRATILTPSYVSITRSERPRAPRAKTIALPPLTPRRLRGPSTGDVKRDLQGLWSMGRPKSLRPPAYKQVVAPVAAAIRTPDFLDYTRGPATMDAVRQHVLQRIPANTNLIVVGHSMGSLVALDLLHDLPSEVNLLGLITLGSPLGYPQFHERVADHRLSEAARRSPIWINIFDPKDIVTGGPPLASSWDKAARAIDVTVDNSRPEPTEGGRHDARNYLRQDAFGVALTGLISSPLQRTRLSALAEIDAARPDEPLRLDTTQSDFHALLRAITTQHRPDSRATALAHTPKASITKPDVERLLVHLAVALNNHDRKRRDRVKALLHKAIGALPFHYLVGTVQAEALRILPEISAPGFRYEGLNAESALWPDVGQAKLGCTPRSFAQTGRGPEQGVNPLSDATTTDIAFIGASVVVLSRLGGQDPARLGDLWATAESAVSQDPVDSPRRLIADTIGRLLLSPAPNSAQK